jgi:hypothetical protein
MITPDKTTRLLKQARHSVINEWGLCAFERLGDRLQRALLAEAVLDLAALQDDEEVPDATVRRIVIEGQSWARGQAGY